MNPVLAQPLAEDSPGDSELWTRFCYVRTRDKFCLETTPRTVFISYLHTENLSDLLQPQRMCFCKISNTAASCPFVFLNGKWVNSANRERGGGGGGAHGETSPRGAHELWGSVRNACNGGARPAGVAPQTSHRRLRLLNLAKDPRLGTPSGPRTSREAHRAALRLFVSRVTQPGLGSRVPRPGPFTSL